MRPLGPEGWGAFAPQVALRELSPTRRRQLFTRMKESGIDRLHTEGRTLFPPVRDEAGHCGLDLVGGIACFSDHAEPLDLDRQPLRPVGPDGSPRARMEWYQGLVPTDPLVVDDLMAATRRAAATPGLVAFNLDFIRWPVHWEIELRGDQQVVDSSFDRQTLERFCSDMGVDVPIDDPVAAARYIHSDLEPEWTAFRCQVITDLTARLTRVVRDVQPSLPIGLFVVPGSESERQRHAGQDVAALGELADVLRPMTYHAILHRPPSWVGRVVHDLRSRTSASVVPVVQATADTDVAGPNDWGAPFPPDELQAAMEAAIEAGADDVVVFPAHGLDDRHLSHIATVRRNR